MGLRYLDVYKDCVGCPVKKYCGTMIGSIKLCNSYELNIKDKEDGKNGNSN